MFFGHDTTLGPLLLAFQQRQNVFPPVGSYVAFELYETTTPVAGHPERFVRMAYNGRELQQPLCGDKTLCPLDEFISSARKRTEAVSDIALTWLQLCPWNILKSALPCRHCRPPRENKRFRVNS